MWMWNLDLAAVPGNCRSKEDDDDDDYDGGF